MTENKNPRLWLIDSVGGECRLEVDRAIEAAERFGASADRITLWGRRAPLDSWSMPVPELCAVLEAMLTTERSPGEVDR